MRALLRAWRRELLRLNLSVVIPALDAAQTLGACLDRLQGAPEIIVVDGGSIDETRDIAEAQGARLIVAPRGRGVQLRAGAEAARGEWLLFLHADTLLGEGWHGAAERHMIEAPGQAACFRFRLASETWQARLVERGVAARVKLFGVPYGDQGLLISRPLYDRIGGYSALPLMEDVEIVRRIGSLRILEANAVTSAERWERDGWFRRSARNLACLGLYLGGSGPERIASFYAGRKS